MRGWLNVLGACGLVAALLLPSAAAASPGELVASFGGNGNGTVRRSATLAVLNQSGKIVTVGVMANGIVIVSRLTVAGHLDPTFGTSGVATFAPLNRGEYSSAALQPDGKILLAGSANGFTDFFVMRLTVNGARDASFGHNGVVTTDVGGSGTAFANTVAAAPGGKIVAAGGASSGAVLLVRYDANGSRDSTFGAAGIVRHTVGTYANPSAVVVQPDSKVVVTGFGTANNRDDTALVLRFDANGDADTAFNGNAGAAIRTARLRIGTRILTQGSSFLVSGTLDTRRPAVIRLGSNGALDSVFGKNGVSPLVVNVANDVSAIALDTSGRILAVGTATQSIGAAQVATSMVSLFRVSAAGDIDKSFGCRGKVVTEMLGTALTNEFEGSFAYAGAVIGNELFVGAVGNRPGAVDIAPTTDVLLKYELGPGNGPGYTLLRRDGGTSAFGSAPGCPSIGGRVLRSPIVGGANDPAAKGSWSVATDGGIFAFGGAHFYGSMGGRRLAAPIVGMAATPDGKGYWMAASDGGVFGFGSARFFGSMGGRHLNAPIVGIAPAPDGHGYWLVASDGGIFTFGSARFLGSMGGTRLASSIRGITATVGEAGYLLVAGDGGVFAFGAARFRGSMGGRHLNSPIVGIAADRRSTGYWLAGADGGVFAFGTRALGSTGATPFGTLGTTPHAAAHVTIGIIGG